MSASTKVTLGQFSCILVSLKVLEDCDIQTPTAPLWPGSGQLGTLWWAGRLISSWATDVAAPIAGLIGIGYVALVSETLWVRILHSAEEDNLSPFDSKIACLCQSIEINNKYVCMYVCACVYVCMFVCLFVCIHVCLYVYMSPFDSNTACLCQSIKNNNNHVYRQS